jgi:xylulokinase
VGQNGHRSASGIDRTSGTTVAAVGLSGQMHGMVALDCDRQVVREAILWNDQRTEKECQEIMAAAGGLEGLLAMTSNQMLTGYYRWQNPLA